MLRGVFIMWKKVFLSIGIIIILIVGIEIFNLSQKKESEDNNIVKNEVNLLSSEFVNDDCVNEWDDYSKTVEEEIKETSSVLNDENRHYILRAENEVVNIYYLNEDDEEILYKVTDVSIKYLSDEDRAELKKGIEFVGIEKMNQLLEDFE